MKTYKMSVLISMVILSALGIVSAAQYGMMGNDGQFYPSQGYGMMGGMMQMMYGYGGYGYGMMLIGWITYLLIIALIITAIYWLIKSANRKR